MRIRLRLIHRALASIAVAGACAVAWADFTTAVDPSVRHQTWEGWGTSLAWSANIFGGYPDKVRNDLCSKLFTYLGLNVVRYNIGGGENPAHNHMERRALVPGYLRPDGTYNWQADANQRWVLLKAKSLGANKFEAFSNSPPYFMTISGCASGNYDAQNNLDPANYPAFADYLAEVVLRFKRIYGVAFETLDPMNEPSTHYWSYGSRQEGCQFDAGWRQSDLILAVANALSNKGVADTRISACDETSNSVAVSSWDALSPEAQNAVWRVNTHSYWGDQQHALNHRATRSGKRLWMSEYGDGEPTGMQMAQQIVKDLRVLWPTAWVYWQAVEQQGYGWGMLEMDLNNLKTQYTITKKFYTFANFSRFIKPGSQFVPIGHSQSVAAVNGSNLTIVTVNPGDEQNATYDLGRFDSVGVKAAIYRTSDTENLYQQRWAPISNKRFSTRLKANSVTTFVIPNCVYSGATYSGYYLVRNRRSGWALNVPSGSWTMGTFLTTDPATNAPSQQWRVESLTNGYYMFRNRDSGHYAAIWNNGSTYPVLQWSDNGDTTLQWAAVQTDPGYWYLRNRRRELAGQNSVMDENADRGNGWPDVIAYPWQSGTGQQWWFDLASPLYPEVPPGLASRSREFRP